MKKLLIASGLAVALAALVAVTAGSAIVLTSNSSSSVDSAPAIQAALDAIESRGGGVVHLEKGEYYCNSPLKIGNNTHLELDPDALIIRQSGDLSIGGATIVNKAGSSGNSNIRVSGGTITTNGATTSVQGKHLGFNNVKQLAIDDVRFLKIYRG